MNTWPRLCLRFLCENRGWGREENSPLLAGLTPGDTGLPEAGPLGCPGERADSWPAEGGVGPRSTPGVAEPGEPPRDRSPFPEPRDPVGLGLGLDAWEGPPVRRACGEWDGGGGGTPACSSAPTPVRGRLRHQPEGPCSEQASSPRLLPRPWPSGVLPMEGGAGHPSSSCGIARTPPALAPVPGACPPFPPLPTSLHTPPSPPCPSHQGCSLS